MRTLVYKMTHIGDPHPVTGVWGATGCMGQVRSYRFDAAIGVGGTSARDGIAGKVVWIGIGPQKTGYRKHPLIRFDRFVLFGSHGPELQKKAPVLSKHLYGRKVRVLLKLSAVERREVNRLLAMARRRSRNGLRDPKCRAVERCGWRLEKSETCTISYTVSRM